MKHVEVTTTENTTKVIILSAVLMLIGVPMTVYAWDIHQTQQDVLEEAVAVDATIIESSVEGPFDDGYRFTVTYAYEYEGDRYENSYFDLDETRSKTYDTKAEAEEARDAYQEGDQVTAYVSPENPETAFLEHNVPISGYLFLGFGGLLVFGSVFMPIFHFSRKMLFSSDRV